MKAIRTALIPAVLFTVACLSARAGDLNPPAGPVAPTMKTLVEVEPRTAINAANTPGDATATFIISQPGSYYLTGNLIGEAGKSGIGIAADNVTIDLNGFTLQGVAGSGHGIRPIGFRNHITIRNGIIAGWGGNGITHFISTNTMSRSRIEGVTAAQNGGFGISGGVQSIYNRCIARSNGSIGIILTNSGGVATECLAASNGSHGFNLADGSSLINCASISNSGSGVNCINSDHLLTGCLIERNSADGISNASFTAITNCTIAGNTGHGITMVGGCRIEGNLISGNNQTGIHGVGVFPSGDNHVEGNTVHLNGGAGIDLTNNTGNMVFRNTLRRNGNNTIVNAAASSAPISNNAATAGPFHNIITP